MKSLKMLHFAVCRSRSCANMKLALQQAAITRNISGTTSCCRSKEPLENLEGNPYFDKYSSKIQQLSPESFQARLEEIKKTKSPKKTETAEKTDTGDPPSKLQSNVVKSTGTLKPKCLDDVMKLEIIEDKTAEHIEQLWKQYHSKRSGLFAVIKSHEYDGMRAKANSCPMFLYPVPRTNGYEFMMAEWTANECHFTTLLSYQTHKENAPVCMSVIYYPELMDKKNIVLMAGEYDLDVLTSQEAQILAHQLQIYYGLGSAERFELVRLFNYSPHNFKHMEVINQFQKLDMDFVTR